MHIAEPFASEIDALCVDERQPAYQDAEKNTWQAIGYRHGMRAGMFDEDARDDAWVWSVRELRQAGEGDVDGYNPRLLKPNAR